VKALVTGGTGFIGSHLVDELLTRNYSVVCTYRKTSDLRWLLNKKVELIETDLSDIDSIKNAIDGVDIIFHVAGSVRALDYQGFLQGNLAPTKNIIDAVLTSKIELKRFVYVSSQTVAGPAPSPDAPLDENTICNPITDYAKSKKAAEDFVIQNKDELPITIIRPPGVFGPRDTAIFSLFKIISLRVAPHFGFTEKYVSLINGMDLSRGIAMSAVSEKTIGEIYYLAYDEYFSYSELFSYVRKALGQRKTLDIKLPESLVLTVGYITEFFGRITKSPPVFNYDKAKDFIQEYWICKSDKAKRDFGFEAKIGMEEAIKKTVNWYIKQGWIN
jgi:dihydroflavonol-4-reductase